MLAGGICLVLRLWPPGSPLSRQPTNPGLCVLWCGDDVLPVGRGGVSASLLLLKNSHNVPLGRTYFWMLLSVQAT